MSWVARRWFFDAAQLVGQGAHQYHAGRRIDHHAASVGGADDGHQRAIEVAPEIAVGEHADLAGVVAAGQVCVPVPVGVASPRRGRRRGARGGAGRRTGHRTRR